MRINFVLHMCRYLHIDLSIFCVFTQLILFLIHLHWFTLIYIDLRAFSVHWVIKRVAFVIYALMRVIIIIARNSIITKKLRKHSYHFPLDQNHSKLHQSYPNDSDSLNILINQLKNTQYHRKNHILL